MLLLYCWRITGVLLLCGCKLRTNPLTGRLDVVKVIITLTLTVTLDNERIWQMSDLISDKKLGRAIGVLWSEYVRGLILLEEFNLEVFGLMRDLRGTDV